MHNIKPLQQKLGIGFNDESLLETALTHRSFINENRRQKLVHNERMEFLGDAVLELVVTEYLYLNSQEPEGVLTNWRSALVKTDALSQVAANLGLQNYIRLSRGEAKGSARAKRQILANTLEAVIGSIYLDKGYKVAQKFIITHVVSLLPEILETGSWMDAKTKLQETVQEKEGKTPTYKVLSEEGPDHDKLFTIGVYIGSQLRGKGSGSSKQTAQQAAAQSALEQISAK